MNGRAQRWMEMCCVSEGGLQDGVVAMPFQRTPEGRLAPNFMSPSFLHHTLLFVNI